MAWNGGVRVFALESGHDHFRLEIISRLSITISLSVVVIMSRDSVIFDREVVTFSTAELMLRHDSMAWDLVARAHSRASPRGFQDSRKTTSITLSVRMPTSGNN